MTRVARVGSFYKDTAICINFDADLVVQLRDLDVIGDGEVRQAAEIGRGVLASCLSSVKDNWNERRTPGKRKVLVTLNKLVPRSTSLLIAVAVQPLVAEKVPPLVISMDDEAVLLNRVDFLNNLLSSKAQQVFSEDYRGELAEAVSSVLQELAAEKITTPFGILLPQNRLFTTSRLGFNLCLHVPNDAAARTFPTSSTTGEWFKATNFHRQLAVYLTLRARDVFSATADEPHALITRSETAWSRVWSTAAELSLPKGDKNRRKTPVDWRSVPHGSLCEEMCCHQVGNCGHVAVTRDAKTKDTPYHGYCNWMGNCGTIVAAEA
ncbi:hypothetical protein AMAG_00291 [Allomyces macrogynus ATCC 38327]|uniref:Uncharacterized protein n=1 Tax=Allomyces macrogynus (strain ATCC 38327) TaxID=578462 RepID=A0A0L0RV34_ALLM3|nr:hypothetical protein AMAG_00291 [Allomyces macrogynus ATCC 38327]|eukprot:KNE54307.1 hypothetical protein AMAG_00291 [Allomyces macrogynus ATCC 38327]